MRWKNSALAFSLAMLAGFTLTRCGKGTEAGGTEADAKRIPPDRRETSLEVSFMGPLPALGFFGRHARRLTVRALEISTETPDARPCVVLEDVQGAIVDGLAGPASSAHAVEKRDSHHVAVGRVRRL